LQNQGVSLAAIGKRLPAMPYPMNKRQGQTLWTTGNEPQ